MKQEYTITVYTENQVGLLNRIAIIFSRRKINIESLNVSPSEAEGIHRFTIVINEFEEVVRKLARQIEKQVEVLKAYYNTNDEIVPAKSTVSATSCPAMKAAAAPPSGRTCRTK